MFAEHCQYFVDVYHQTELNIRNATFMLSCLESFDKAARGLYKPKGHLITYKDVYCQLVLETVPKYNVTSYNDGFLNSLAKHLCQCLDYLIGNRVYHYKVFPVLAICFTRLQDKESSALFCSHLDGLIGLLDSDAYDCFVDHVLTYLSTERMILPRAWLTASPFNDPLIKAILQIINGIGNPRTDPNYFLSFATYALIRREQEIVKLVADLFFIYPYGVFTASHKDIVMRFFSGLEELLPRHVAAPLIERFLESDYHKVPTSRLIGALTLVSNYRSNTSLNESHHLREQNSLKSALLTLYSSMHPWFVTNEPIPAAKAVMGKLLRTYSTGTEALWNSAVEANIATFVCGFLLSWSGGCMGEVEPEIAYIFVTGLFSCLQRYIIAGRTPIQLLDNVDSAIAMDAAREVILTAEIIEGFKPVVVEAFKIIRAHVLFKPNSLSIKFLSDSLFLIHLLDLQIENLLIDAVLMDLTSIPLMWAVVYGHLRSKGRSECARVFNNALVYHLSRPWSQERECFLNKFIEFCEANNINLHNSRQT